MGRVRPVGALSFVSASPWCWKGAVMDLGMVLAVGALAGAIYCIGGIHGLLMAWTQEARMKRWADWVSRNYTALVDEVAQPAQRKDPA